jgi:adenylate kinase
VPDTLLMDVLRKPVVAASSSGGYILDGFPRTVEQAQIAYAVAKEIGVEAQVAVHLDVARDELVRRLLARGRGSDDTEAVIEHRLEVYMEHTVPMLDYYELREELVRVDGGRTPDEVSWSLVSRLQNVRRALQL